MTSSPVASANAPAWVVALRRVATAALPGAGPGRGVRLNRAIDLHKGLTGPAVLGLMVVFDVFSPQALTYLALHGSYGLAWVVKDRRFPDRQWRRRVSWKGAAAAWCFLSLYWVAPALLVLGSAGALDLGGWEPAGPAGLAGAGLVYAVGLALMLGADAQKNRILARRSTTPPDLGPPNPDAGLITTGLYARIRHPNYLGEMMIYGAFAGVVGHWLPWLILAAIWGLVFLPNMLAIEASLSRYPEYGAWKRRTGFLLPKLPIGRTRRPEPKAP